MGFDPSQFCSCPQAAGCFHRAGPTCRLLSVRPGLRFFRREINRLLPSLHPLRMNRWGGRSIQDAHRDSWVSLAGNPRRAIRWNVAPADTALGFDRSFRSVGHGFSDVHSSGITRRNHQPAPAFAGPAIRSWVCGSGRVTRCWAKQLPRHGTPWPSLQRFWRLMPVRFRRFA